MKPPQHITFTAAKTTPTQVVQWAQALTHLHARIASRFARPAPRRRALAYLPGRLRCSERKNGWHLAEQAREARPAGRQRLLSQAVWDTDGVRDDLRQYALEHLGQAAALVVMDESRFPKRGKKSAGVQVHYGRTTGHGQNCPVGVFLAYVTARGHPRIARERSLPRDWTAEPQRCQEASIPASVRFRTKPELAVQMIERLWKAQIPMTWVLADTVSGGNLDWRTWLEAQGSPCVLALACDEPVGILTAEGGRRRLEALPARRTRSGSASR